MNFIQYFIAFAALTSAASSGKVVEVHGVNINVPEGMEFLGSRFDAVRGFNYFLISDNKIEWNKAQKICQAESTRLVVIDSQEKDEDLIGFLSSKQVKEGWTAGNDHLKNGDYVWATSSGSTPMGPYFNWRDGVAPNVADCACVSIESKIEGGCNQNCEGVYKWDEGRCGDQKRFICEI